MYITDVLLENSGPIENLDVHLPFTRDGLPKPVIIVGENGSGKTVLLSTLADSLVETAKMAYPNVLRPNERVISQGFGNVPFFRVIGPQNVRSGSKFSLSIVRLSNTECTFYFVEKYGNLAPADKNEKLQQRFGTTLGWDPDLPTKTVTGGTKQVVESSFLSGSICYFPSSRHELPHWLNTESRDHEVLFNVSMRIAGHLDKPIIVERTAKENKQWLLDVMLDSMIDIAQTDNGFQAVDWENKQLLRRGRANIDLLLKKVLNDDAAEMVLAYRQAVPQRIVIKCSDDIVIYGIDALSSGQAILFNLFATIIRYADQGDINRRINLDSITGIVLIDEVDAHLHTELQYDLLPKLIALFPKIQFILTSHSPLFILGMEKEFGADGISILDMPSGLNITAERFTEFKKSLEYYRRTEEYETDLTSKLKKNERLLVLTEGDTDPDYILTCLELRGRMDLKEAIEIEWIGTYGDKGKGAINTGMSALDHAASFLSANPSFNTHTKVMLLYDWDAKKPCSSSSNLLIRCIPKSESNMHGIENLIPSVIVDARFITQKKVPNNCGTFNIIYDLKKRELCDWICRERREVNDFIAFDPIIAFLEELIQDPN